VKKERSVETMQSEKCRFGVKQKSKTIESKGRVGKAGGGGLDEETEDEEEEEEEEDEEEMRAGAAIVDDARIACAGREEKRMSEGRGRRKS
jgi:Ran GTPase-activating protein (RanGAP) involved in mRNA processing and transport